MKKETPPERKTGFPDCACRLSGVGGGTSMATKEEGIDTASVPALVISSM